MAGRQTWCDHGGHAVMEVVGCAVHAQVDASRPLSRPCFHCAEHPPVSVISLPSGSTIEHRIGLEAQRLEGHSAPKPLAGLNDAGSNDPTSPKNSLTTPRDLFDRLDAEHHFALDAAASHENALIDTFCTVNGTWRIFSETRLGEWVDDDGYSPDGIDIARVWTPDLGAVFCNPPFGRGLIEPFVAAWAEAARERGVTSVFLLPVRTDQPWWQAWVWDNETSSRRRWVRRLEFPPRRVRYGGLPSGAPFPSTIITFGSPDD